MTEAEIIADVIDREGGYVDHPSDRGGATKFGITAATLGAWRKLGRAATRAEVQGLKEPEAGAIYRHRYILGPGFDAIADPVLRVNVIDDGILSGPVTAVKTLQRAVGVAADGVLGPRTKAAISAADPVVLHVRIVKARLIRYAHIVERDRSQGDFIEGWVRRALGFLDDRGGPRA